MKILFLNTYKLVIKEREFAKLLNLIPEGIGVLDNKQQLMYSN